MSDDKGVPSTCEIASIVRSVGLDGVPGRDSPFSYFWYVYLVRPER